MSYSGGYGSVGSGTRSPSSSDDYAKIIDRCSYNVQKFLNNVKELEKLLQQIGTKNHSEKLSEDIKQKQQNTNNLISTTMELLRQLNSLPCSDGRQRTQAGRITSQLESGVKRYSMLQEDIMRRLQDARRASLPPQDDFFGNDSEPFASQDQITVQTDELRIQEEREREMRELHRNVVEVEDMFRDLSAIVYEQADALNDIESNITKATDEVQSGNEQLSQAVRYKRKARKKCICIVVTVIIILAIIGLILGLELKPN